MVVGQDFKNEIIYVIEMIRQVLKPQTFRQPVFLSIRKFSSLSNYNSLTSNEARKIREEYLKMIDNHKKEIEEKHKKQIREMKSDIEHLYDLGLNRYNNLNNDINEIKGDISDLKDKNVESSPKYPEQGSIYDPYAPENRSRTITKMSLSCIGGTAVALVSSPVWGVMFTCFTFPRQYPYRVDYD